MPLCEGDASIHGVVHAIVGLGEEMGDKAREFGQGSDTAVAGTAVHDDALHALKARDWQRLQGAERGVEPSTVVSDRHNDAQQGASRHAWLSMSRSPSHFKVRPGRRSMDVQSCVAMTNERPC